MSVRQIFKILAWTLGSLLVLVGLLSVGCYLFVTSDYVRAQVENHARAMSGHETKIAKLAIDWGWTPHVHLQQVELSNADWGKADHMFKAQQIEFDIRLWPLLHGDIVLPHLMLRKPEVYLERGANDQSNWSPEESPVADAAVKQVAPQQRHETPAYWSAGDHRWARRLHRPEAEVGPERNSFDGNRAGGRRAGGTAVAQR
jgi:AsmA family protein